MRKLLVGAASRDISPTKEFFPMKGGFGTVVTGVHNPLHARAIALDDGENRAVILTQELGGVAEPDRLLEAMGLEFGLSKEYIFMQATHAHAAPMVGKNPFFREKSTAEELAKMDLLAQWIFDRTMDAVREAFANLQPAVVKYGKGESHINVNRTQDFRLRDNISQEDLDFINSLGMKIREEKEHRILTMLGVNPTGPSDKTLAVLKFEGEDGKSIAWFLNHSTHSVVMHRNTLNVYDSDFSGLTALLIEQEYPGCVAMWTAGSAGDNNPIYMSDNYAPIPASGFTTGPHRSNHDPLDLLERVAYPHFSDFLQISQAMEELQDVKVKAAAEVALPVSKDPADPAKIEMSLLQIGPVNLVGVHGELFTTIGQHLKEESRSDKTIIVSYNAKSSANNAGYILDDDGLVRGAWGWKRYKAVPGVTQSVMTETMKKMFREAK